MTHVVTTPPPLRPKPLDWPRPSTIITQVAPTQYFPQGPIGR